MVALWAMTLAGANVIFLTCTPTELTTLELTLCACGETLCPTATRTLPKTRKP